MEARILTTMKRHAFAVIPVEPDGGLSSNNIIQHKEGENAPLKLIVFTQRPWAGEGEEQIIGEIGFGRFHPYRSYGRVPVRLRQKRICTSRLTEKQVASVRIELCEILHGLMKSRAYLIPEEPHKKIRGGARRGWRDSNGSTLHHNFLPGPMIAVNKQDAALVQLFSELESLTPYIHWRLEQIAWQINRLPRKPLTNKVPHASRQLREQLQQSDIGHLGLFPLEYWGVHDRLLANRYWQPLLRPHIIGALARHLKYAGEFLDFLVSTELIKPAGYSIAYKLLEDPTRPIIDYQILPSEARASSSLSKKDGFPVNFHYSGSDFWTIQIVVTQRVWYDRRRLFIKPAIKEPDWVSEDLGKLIPYITLGD